MKRQKLKLVVSRPRKLVTKVKKENIKAVASIRDGGTLTIKGSK